MNRARWYSTSTTLLNGEIYIQGGSGGTDRPEIRATERHVPPAERRQHERARLHVSAQLHRAGRPRVRLRQRGPHVLRQPDRHRHASRSVGQFAVGVPRQRCRARRCSGPAASCSSAATPTARRHRHQRRHAGRHADAVDVDAAPPRERHDPAERQGARDRRQRGRGTS